MPRPRSRNRVNDSDEEMPSTSQAGVSQSQTQLSQTQKSIQNMSDEEINKKVNDLVHYLLIMDQKKLPIKRIDINKNVLKEHSRFYAHFMDKADKKLTDVFGIKLEEIDGKQKSYILVNLLESDTRNPHLNWPSDDNKKMGLVMVILSLIFMNGNAMGEAQLFATLKKLGVDTDSRDPNKEFGDVKKLVCTEFVRQGYVEYIRLPATDPPEYEFRWGPRAEKETSKKNVLDFVCEVYKEDHPENWTSQWQDVLRSEGMPEAVQDAANSQES